MTAVSNSSLIYRSNSPSNADNTDNNPPSKWQKVASKIGQIAKYAFLTLLGTSLFFINSTLFAIGFMVGIIWSDKTKEVIDKVSAIWKKQPWGVSALIGCAAFLSLHVTLAAGSLFFAARLGNWMEKSSEKKTEPKPEENPEV